MVAGHLTASSLSAYLLLLLVSTRAICRRCLKSKWRPTAWIWMPALGRMPLLDHVPDGRPNGWSHRSRTHRDVSSRTWNSRAISCARASFCSARLRAPIAIRRSGPDPPQIRSSCVLHRRAANGEAIPMRSQASASARAGAGTLLAQVMVKVMVHPHSAPLHAQTGGDAFAPSVAILAPRGR